MPPTGKPEYLLDLNPPQSEAVLHTRGPLLVLAGAGSGKTRVLTRRIAHLVLEHKINPAQILAITFTNKAAGEMRERLEVLLGERAQRLWAATFHSTGLRILRRHAELLGYSNRFTVYDDDDTRTVIKNILIERGVDLKKYPPIQFLKAIDRAKNANQTPEDFAAISKQYQHQLEADIYDAYQKELMRGNAMDFGDLLMNALRLFKTQSKVLRQYQEILLHVLVDEFQDTNSVQYELVRLLALPQNNLFVVGDDDQSIYAFRGATVKNILEFEKDFPGTKIIALEQNYRSTTSILDCANAVIAKNPRRHEKKLWTAIDGGKPVTTYLAYDERGEAEFIASEIDSMLKRDLRRSEMAVFYRTNAQSRALEDAFRRYQIPYKLFGALKFYERKEIKDIIAYLRVIANTKDNQAFLRSLNTPSRGIGAQTARQIVESESASRGSLFDAARSFAVKHKGIRSYVELIDGLRSRVAELSLSELIEEVLVKTGYRERLAAGKDITAQSRIENLNELVNAAREDAFLASTEEALQAFLDQVALVAANDQPSSSYHGDNEEPPEEVVETVSLMTLHLAKGLEFPIVFFTGLEEGLVPHYRSIQEGDIDEERRLCYVGITRAKQELYLTRAQKRGLFSSSSIGADPSGYFRQASRFAFDLPTALLNDLSGGMFLADEYADWFEQSEVEPENSECEADENSDLKEKSQKPTAPIKFADELI